MEKVLGSKRDSERIRFRQKVKYGPEDKAGTDAVSINLSASGIAIKSYKSVTPGTTISLVLFSSDKPIRLHGVVIWNNSKDDSNNTEMGIRITGRKDELSRLYQEHSLKEY